MIKQKVVPYEEPYRSMRTAFPSFLHEPGPGRRINLSWAAIDPYRRLSLWAFLVLMAEIAFSAAFRGRRTLRFFYTNPNLDGICEATYLNLATITKRPASARLAGGGPAPDAQTGLLTQDTPEPCSTLPSASPRRSLIFHFS